MRRSKKLFNLFGLASLLLKVYFNFLYRLLKNELCISYFLVNAIFLFGLNSLDVLIAFPVFFFIVIFVFLIILKEKEDIKFKDLRNRLDYWWSLNGWEFEEAVGKVLRSNGYERVQVTQKTNDGGVDIVFYKNGIKYIVQCKHYRDKVSVNMVRELWGVKEDFKADKVIMLASSGVTKQGLEFIKSKRDYILWTLNDILGMSRS